ncbi:uncharacterized protein LOC144124363 [Amblyomma americanum]
MPLWAFAMAWGQVAPTGAQWSPMTPPTQSVSPASTTTSTAALLGQESGGSLSSPQSTLSDRLKDSLTHQVVCVGLSMVVTAVLGSVLTLLALSLAMDPAEVTGATYSPGNSPGIKVPNGGVDVTHTTSATRATNVPTTITATTATTVPDTVERQAKVFTRGKLYYRSAYLDEAGGYLFIGAMDQLFKLRLEDISQEPVTLGPDVDCRNHIREVHPIRNGSTLYVCGTNSRNPTDWQLQIYGGLTVPRAGD